MTDEIDDLTRRRQRMKPAPAPFDIDEFRAVLDVTHEELLAAKTREQWEVAIAVFVSVVHEKAPDATAAALAVAAFMRGVLEGAGVRLPWAATQGRSPNPVKRRSHRWRSKSTI